MFRRAFLPLFAALFVALLTTFAAVSPAGAFGYQDGYFVATAQPGSGYTLNTRAAPNTSSTIGYTYQQGQEVIIFCYVTGQTINGNWGPTNIWYQTPAGEHPRSYVSDGFIYTGSNDAVVPACDQPGGGSSSAIPVATASTAGYPLNVRSGPSTANAVVRTQADGSYVELSCSITGQAIVGPWGTTTLWYRLMGGGYVSDAVIFTGTDDPIAAPCRTPSTSQAFVTADGTPLNVRAGPAGWESWIRTIPDGTFLDLDCAVSGQVIWGAWGVTDLWYRLDGGGYVSDGYLYTGSNEPVRPPCTGGAGTPASSAQRQSVADAAQAELSGGQAWETGSGWSTQTSPRVNQYLALTGLPPAKPWCAAFASWVVNHPASGSAITSFRSASVGEWVSAARRLHFNLRLISPSAVEPGDLVAIDEDGGSDFYGASHMGVVTAPIIADRVLSIDGNTFPQGRSSPYGLFARDRALNTNAGGTMEMVFIRIG